MTRLLPKCYSCVHFRGFDKTYDASGRGRVTCDAFPEDIPDDIFTGGALHDTPYPGDHGIQYEPRPFIDWRGLLRGLRKLVGR